MKKVFYLSTCDTCKRILKELQPDTSWELKDIKTNPVTLIELEELEKYAGNMEMLFSKRSRNYKLKIKEGENPDRKRMLELILEDYTFLKRPVFIAGKHVFAGSEKNTLESLKKFLQTNP